MKNDEWMLNFHISKAPVWDRAIESSPNAFKPTKDAITSTEAKRHHELMREEAELEYLNSEVWENEGI